LSYVALYRVWRPKRWEDVVNQKPVVRILENALLEGKVSHAYLFSGPRGTGKTTVARLLAKAVNCVNLQGAEPCNACEPCKAISEGTSVDVMEIDAASNRGIDEIRSLRESVRYLPVMGKHKVYIIDEVHMLTQEAFNALLKTIEEPPEHVIFILATTAPHKIPVTITSRCQRLEFKRLSVSHIEEQMRKILKMQGITWEESALPVIARAAQGSMRDALSILDLCITYGEGKLQERDVRDILGETSHETMMRLFRAIAQNDLKGILDVTGEVSDWGKDMGEFSLEISLFARDLLFLRSSGKAQDLGRTEDEVREMLTLARSFSPSLLIFLLEAASKAVSEIKQSDNPRLVVETSLLGLFLEQGAGMGMIPARPGGTREDQAERVAQVRPEMREPLAAKGAGPEEVEPRRDSEVPFQEKPPQDIPAPETIPVTAALEAETAGKKSADEIVKEAWPKLLEELFRKRKVQARAYLLPASPLRVEGDDTLILGYRKGYATHMEQIMVPSNKKIVEQYLEKITGRHFSLKVEVSELNGDGDGDDAGLHPLVKAAINLLDGKVVKQS